MAIPSYATSMIANYRQMYKERYGQPSQLDDDQIWLICNEIFDDTSKPLEDEARVETMRQKEQAS